MRFSVTVEDYEHWSTDHLKACDDNDSYSDYADWVVDQLEDVMRKAGNEFINKNSDLFRSDEII
jgi:hypothetical protein